VSLNIQKLFLNISSSCIHYTIDSLVPIAEISYLKSKKVNNPSGNLTPKNGIRKKGIRLNRMHLNF